jgi:hypothetical protein
MSEFGTFETCRRTVKMSAYWGIVLKKSFRADEGKFSRAADAFRP